MSEDLGMAALPEQARRLASELHGQLRRLRLRSGDTVVEIEWQTSTVQTGHRGLEPQPEEPDSGAATVTSPMVGTFYRAPEPGAEPYVAVGDAVVVGQVVGIVEAMKLMNPILAEVAGRVIAVHVADGQPVEYGQALLGLDPFEQEGPVL